MKTNKLVVEIGLDEGEFLGDCPAELQELVAIFSVLAELGVELDDAIAHGSSVENKVLPMILCG